MTISLKTLCSISKQIGYFSFSRDKNVVTYDCLGSILYNNLKHFWLTSEKDVKTHPELIENRFTQPFDNTDNADHTKLLFTSLKFITDFNAVKKVEKSFPLAISHEFSSNFPFTNLIRSDEFTNCAGNDSIPQTFSNYLSTSYFIHPGSSNEMFNRIQRSKKIWWMKFCSNPGRIFFSERQTFNKNDELISVKARYDFGELELERIRLVPITNDDFLMKGTKRMSKIHPHIIQTQTSPDIGSLAILFDAIESSRIDSLLHLHRKIVPFQCAVIALSSKTDAINSNLDDLVTYVSLMLNSSRVSSVNSTKNVLPLTYRHSSLESLENDLVALDKIGVPYTLVLDEQILQTGMLKLRSRDTSLNEIIHLSDVPEYLVKIINS